MSLSGLRWSFLICEGTCITACYNNVQYSVDRQLIKWSASSLFSFKLITGNIPSEEI